MYTKAEMIELLANETGLDLDYVESIYTVLFGNVESVDIDTAHDALLTV